MNGLLITSDFDNKILDGGQYVNKRNYEVLSKCCENLDVIKTNKISNNSLKRKINTFLEIIICGSFYGESIFMKRKIVNLLKTGKYDFCFISQSLGGNLAYYIKKRIKNIKVIVFFHNVEYDFYKQLAETSSKYKYLLALNAKKNEKYAIKYADNIIALNIRDAKKIFNMYGREVDFIFPTTFKDLCENIKLDRIIYKNDEKNIKTLLFVGSDFYANFQGIEWFIKNVLPYLDKTVLNIVGKGTEKWRDSFKDIRNLNILGSVESLEDYYLRADAIVLPIFLGSGMKTKTAEALMYGKYIFGTKEAFEGYDIDYDKIGCLCNNREDFIEKINNHFKVVTNIYNEYSRKIFLEKYDTNKWVTIMNYFLNNK